MSFVPLERIHYEGHEVDEKVKSFSLRGSLSSSASLGDMGSLRRIPNL